MASIITRKGYKLTDVATGVAGQALNDNFTKVGDDIEALQAGIGIVEVGPGTDNIQPAVDALASTGGCIHLGVGTYTFTTPVTISKSNVQIMGCGDATEIVSSATAAFDVTATDRVRIQNMRIEMSGAVGVKLSAGTNHLVRGVTIRSTATSGNGIEFAGALLSVVDRCLIERVSGSLVSILANSAPNRISNSTFLKISMRGIYSTITTGKQLQVSNCYFELDPLLSAIGIQLRLVHSNIVNCVIDGKSNNNPTGGFAKGIMLHGGGDSIVQACQILDIRRGISAEFSAGRHTVMACRIENCLEFGAQFEFDFCEECTVANNIIRNCGKGIRSSQKKNRFNGNIIIDSISQAIELTGTRGQENIVAGNTIVGTGNIIQETVTSANRNLIHGNHILGGTITLKGAQSVAKDNFF